MGRLPKAPYLTLLSRRVCLPEFLGKEGAYSLTFHPCPAPGRKQTASGIAQIVRILRMFPTGRGTVSFLWHFPFPRFCRETPALRDALAGESPDFPPNWLLDIGFWFLEASPTTPSGDGDVH